MSILRVAGSGEGGGTGPVFGEDFEGGFNHAWTPFDGGNGIATTEATYGDVGQNTAWGSTAIPGANWVGGMQAPLGQTLSIPRAVSDPWIRVTGKVVMSSALSSPVVNVGVWASTTDGVSIRLEEHGTNIDAFISGTLTSGAVALPAGVVSPLAFDDGLQHTIGFEIAWIDRNTGGAGPAEKVRFREIYDGVYNPWGDVNYNDLLDPSLFVWGGRRENHLYDDLNVELVTPGGDLGDLEVDSAGELRGVSLPIAVSSDVYMSIGGIQVPNNVASAVGGESIIVTDATTSPVETTFALLGSSEYPIQSEGGTVAGS